MLNRYADGKAFWPAVSIKCVQPSLVQVKAAQRKGVNAMANGRARISHIERSDKYPELRWVQFDTGEERYSLWDKVFDGDLVLGQLVEFTAEPVDGRSFQKITSLCPVRSRKKASQQQSQPQAQEPKADGFSKTEIGLMASVAIKVAARLVKDPDDSAELFRKADVIYAWLAEKRVKELAGQVK